MTLVLITGATRGIGQAAAVQLARAGAELAVVGRDPERVEMVAGEAEAAGGGARVHQHVADLSLMAAVRALAAAMLAPYARSEVLTNTAGSLFSPRRETASGLTWTVAPTPLP